MQQPSWTDWLEARSHQCHQIRIHQTAESPVWAQVGQMSDRLTVGQGCQEDWRMNIWACNKPLTAACVLAHGLIRGVYILPNICHKRMKYVQFVSEHVDLTSEIESNCVKLQIGICWVKQFAAVCAWHSSQRVKATSCMGKNTFWFLRYFRFDL